MSEPVIALNKLTKSYGKHLELRKSALRSSAVRFSALSALTGRESPPPSVP